MLHPSRGVPIKKELVKVGNMYALLLDPLELCVKGLLIRSALSLIVMKDSVLNISASIHWQRTREKRTRDQKRTREKRASDKRTREKRTRGRRNQLRRRRNQLRRRRNRCVSQESLFGFRCQIPPAHRELLINHLRDCRSILPNLPLCRWIKA